MSNNATRQKPNIVMAYYHRGISKAALGQHKQAIDDFDTVIILKEDFGDAYCHRGISKEALGYYSEATEDYTTALKHKRGNPLAHYHRGIIRMIFGYTNEGRLDINLALKYATHNEQLRNTIEKTFNTLKQKAENKETTTQLIR